MTACNAGTYGMTVCNTVTHGRTVCNAATHCMTACNTGTHGMTACNAATHGTTMCNTVTHGMTVCNTVGCIVYIYIYIVKCTIYNKPEHIYSKMNYIKYRELHYSFVYCKAYYVQSTFN